MCRSACSCELTKYSFSSWTESRLNQLLDLEQGNAYDGAERHAPQMVSRLHALAPVWSYLYPMQHKASSWLGTLTCAISIARFGRHVFQRSILPWSASAVPQFYIDSDFQLRSSQICNCGTKYSSNLGLDSKRKKLDAMIIFSVNDFRLAPECFVNMAEHVHVLKTSSEVHSKDP